MVDRITFKCADCGHPVVIDKNKPPKDDDIITCRGEGCGRAFGTYAQVRQAMIQAGKEKVDRLIDGADLPPWIRRSDK